MIKNVIFDLDGTLLDTKAGIFESIAYAVQQLGYPALSAQKMETFLGPPLPDSFVRNFSCSEIE